MTGAEALLEAATPGCSKLEARPDVDAGSGDSAMLAAFCSRSEVGRDRLDIENCAISTVAGSGSAAVRGAGKEEDGSARKEEDGSAGKEEDVSAGAQGRGGGGESAAGKLTGAGRWFSAAWAEPLLGTGPFELKACEPDSSGSSGKLW